MDFVLCLCVRGLVCAGFFLDGTERKKNLLFKATSNCLAVQDHGNAGICILLYHDKRVVRELLINAGTESALMSLHTQQQYSETY